MCVFSPFISWHVRAIGINTFRRELSPKERLCLQLRLLLCGITHELPQDVTPAHQVIHLLRRQVTLGDQTLQTGELVRSVSLVGTELFKGPDVVLCVLVLQGRSDGLGLLGSVGPRALELLNDAVEGLDGATSGVKTTTNGTVGASVGVEEVDEVLLGAGASVWEGLGGTLGEVLDGGVGRDALLLSESLGVFSFSVNLGDQDAGLRDKVVGEGFPDGGEGLAVCVFVSYRLQAEVRSLNIRPHHGAVKATSTSWSFPTFSLKLLSSR